MTHIQPVTRTAAAPVEQRPDPAKVLAGDPVHTTWGVEDDQGLYCVTLPPPPNPV